MHESIGPQQFLKSSHVDYTSCIKLNAYFTNFIIIIIVVNVPNQVTY